MPEKKSNKIIVTGGTGLLGSHLLIALARTEHEIVALKRSSSQLSTVKKLFRWYFKNDQQFDNIHWVEGDITDVDSLLEIFSSGSRIYHVAGKVSFNKKNLPQLIDTNIAGTANVVNAALKKKIEKLCYVSSIAAIGRANGELLTHEDIPLENLSKISAYAISKYEGEREVWRGIAEGLNAVIVNPTIILGPGNWNDSSARLFHQVYKGLNYYTPGSNGYVDADDLAKIMIQLMNSDVQSQRFIISSENVSYKQLFTWIAEALHVDPPKHLAGPYLSALAWRLLKFGSLFTGKAPLITRETAQTANSLYQYSSQKIIDQTGYRFKPVKETIAETAQYFLEDLKGSI